jgi:glycosyltransferase involved in cell wall biosynthesis
VTRSKGRTVLLASPGGRKGRGGMASLVTHLADALPERLPGVRVDILDTYGPGAFAAMPFSFAAALLKVILRALAGRLHLLHIHMAAYGSVVRKCVLAMAAIWIGVPTIMHLHGAEFDEFWRNLSAQRRRLLVYVLWRCARVIVIGNYWREFVVNELGLDPGRVVLIHNGVPAALPAFSHRKIAGNPPRLLMLGELGARKGTPELVAALARPELRQAEWTATLAGDGDIDHFRTTVAALGLSTRIRVPGWQSPTQVRALLQEADILVLPSHQEGLPMAILEAMASSAAVIATPVGSIPDAITDRETGLLVPCGDPAALARAILELLNDTALRQRLSANALARFDRSFTIDATSRAVAELYRELGVV